jgi:hypothetical protein
MELLRIAAGLKAGSPSAALENLAGLNPAGPERFIF